MKSINIIIYLLILSPVHLFSQTISGNPIDAKSEVILKAIMDSSGVTELTISSTNRTIPQQVEVMYDYIKNHGVQNANALYGPEGQAVIAKYVEGVNAKKTEAEIKHMMIDELTLQLPSAIKNNRLMHVGREKDFSVFDVSIRSIRPADKKDGFEKVAKQFAANGVLFRFLGTENAEKDAFHFEVKK